MPLPSVNILTQLPDFNWEEDLNMYAASEEPQIRKVNNNSIVGRRFMTDREGRDMSNNKTVCGRRLSEREGQQGVGTVIYIDIGTPGETEGPKR